MRVLSLACALLAATSVARADDDGDDAEDAAFTAVPTFSIGISLAGHGTRIEGRSESGFGPALELALGRGRWQYFVEGGVALAGMDASMPGALEMDVSGRMLHAGLGARWLARQFRPDRTGGVELFLLSRLGLERFSFEDDTAVTRPDLALGVGLQMRLYKRPRIAFRIDARVLETAASRGFAAGVGFAW